MTSEKNKQVTSLQQLMDKENFPKKRFVPHKQPDKAGVPNNYEFRVRGDATEVSSITVPEVTRNKFNKKRARKKSLFSHSKSTATSGSSELSVDEHEKEAAEAMSQMLKNGGSFDEVILTAASMLDEVPQGPNSPTSTFTANNNTHQSKPNENNTLNNSTLDPTTATNENDYSLNWSMISVKVTSLILKEGGSDEVAQAVASSILASSRNCVAKGRDASETVGNVAAKATKAALDAGCSEATAAQVSNIVMKHGMTLSEEQQGPIVGFETPLDDEQTMLLTAIEETDTKRAQVASDIEKLKKTRIARKKELDKSEIEAKKQKRELNKRLAVMDKERFKLEKILSESSFQGTHSTHYTKEIGRKLHDVERRRDILKDEMTVIEKENTQRKKKLTKTERRLRKKERMLKRKMNALWKDRMEMAKALQEKRNSLMQRRRQQNQIKGETKGLLNEKARLSEKLKILRAEIKKAKVRNAERLGKDGLYAEKMAATKIARARIGKENRKVDRKENERMHYEDSLFGRIEAIEQEKAALLNALEKVKYYMNDKEMTLEAAGFDGQKAQMALMQQIAEVEAERNRYLDLVQQTKQNKTDRQRFQELVLREQAAAEAEKERLQERIKQVQQAEVIFRKKEQAFRNRVLSAELEIISDWEKQQREEEELMEKKRVKFNLDYPTYAPPQQQMNNVTFNDQQNKFTSNEDEEGEETDDDSTFSGSSDGSTVNSDQYSESLSDSDSSDSDNSADNSTISGSLSKSISTIGETTASNSTSPSVRESVSSSSTGKVQNKGKKKKDIRKKKKKSDKKADDVLIVYSTSGIDDDYSRDELSSPSHVESIEVTLSTSTGGSWETDISTHSEESRSKTTKSSGDGTSFLSSSLESTTFTTETGTKSTTLSSSVIDDESSSRRGKLQQKKKKQHEKNKKDFNSDEQPVLDVIVEGDQESDLTILTMPASLQNKPDNNVPNRNNFNGHVGGNVGYNNNTNFNGMSGNINLNNNINNSDMNQNYNSNNFNGNNFNNFGNQGFNGVGDNFTGNNFNKNNFQNMNNLNNQYTNNGPDVTNLVSNIPNSTPLEQKINYDLLNSKEFNDDWFETSESFWDAEKTDILRELTQAELNKIENVEKNPSSEPNIDNKKAKGGWGSKLLFKKKKAVKDSTDDFRTREIHARLNLQQKLVTDNTTMPIKISSGNTTSVDSNSNTKKKTLGWKMGAKKANQAGKPKEKIPLKLFGRRKN